MSTKTPGEPEGHPGEWNGADVTGVRRDRTRGHYAANGRGHDRDRDSRGSRDDRGSRNKARSAERRKPPATGNMSPVAGSKPPVPNNAGHTGH